MKKIGFIVLTCILSIVLLFFFVLRNFPYGAVLKRIDTYLAREYGANLSVGTVTFHYPFRLTLGDFRVTKRDGSFSLKASDLNVRLHLLNFSRHKTFDLGGRGIQVRSSYVHSSKSRLNVLSRLRLRAQRKEPEQLPIDFISFTVQGTEIEKASLSGFEFSSFKIPSVELVLQKENGYLNVKRGSVKSDLFSSDISGRLNLSGMDLAVGVKMSGEFFRRYSDLTGIFDQIGKDGALKISIQGSTTGPVVRVVK